MTDDSGQMTVGIRTYEALDYKQVWELHVEAQKELGFPYGVPERDGDLQTIEEVYLQPGSGFWIADAGGVPVGTAALHRIDRRTAELKRMRVTAAYRRQGIAQRLLETAEDFCREQGYKRIVLDTTERQEAARRLYEKNGYIRSDERLRGGFMAFLYEKAIE